MGGLGRMRLATTVATGALISAFSPASISAQLVSTVPGVQTTIQADANGVDLVTGVFTLNHVDLTFGPNASTRLKVATQLGSGDGDNYSGYVFERNEGGVNYVYTVRGSETSKFSSDNGTYRPVDGSGVSLSHPDAYTYLLTEADGTKVEFLHQHYNSGGLYRGSGNIDHINYIQYPDGERLSFAMKVGWSQWCERPEDEYGRENGSAGRTGHRAMPLNLSDRDDDDGAAAAVNGGGVTEAPPGGVVCRRFPWRRVQSITSNLGYQLRFAYENDEVPADTSSYNGYATTKSVTAVNLRVDHCEPAALACTYSRPWPRLDYTARNSAEQQANTAYTDSLGREWSVLTTYADGWPHQIEVRRASGSTPHVVATLSDRKVASVQTPAGTWTYNWSDSGGQRTVVVTDPLGGARTVVSDIETGFIASDTNALNQTRRYEPGMYGRIKAATMPEGNSEEYEYDNRGNVVTLTRHAKPGSSAADIVTRSTYPQSCASPVSCNLPTSSTDAGGNMTVFAWDDTHGGLLSVTRPAVNGVSPKTSYTYQPLEASVKDASGGSVGTGLPVWRLVEESACRTMASCAGTGDEARTTLGYGPNLLLSSMTRGSGDGTVSSGVTLAYDEDGNLTGVDGPLPGTADTQVMRYDAARRLVGTIAPDPDGGGPRRRRAERVSYDADDRVTKREVGTVSDASDAAWGQFAPAQAAVSSYDARGFKVRDTVTAGGTTFGVSDYAYDGKGRPTCSAVRMNPGTWANVTDACTLQATGSQGPDRITRTSYDELDRPVEVMAGYGTAAASRQARVGFTPNGEAASAMDANDNVTSYAYDGHDRPLRTSYAGGGYEEVTSRDAAGNVTGVRLRDGQVLGYRYDALGRLEFKDVPAGVIHEYDVAYGYDLMGRLLRAEDANGHFTAFGYDALGRRVSETSNASSRTSAYDAAGRRVRLTWGTGSSRATSMTGRVSWRWCGRMAAFRWRGTAMTISGGG